MSITSKKPELLLLILPDADDAARYASACMARGFRVGVPATAEVILVSVANETQRVLRMQWTWGARPKRGAAHTMTDRPTMESGPCSVSRASSISTLQLPMASDCRLPRSPACLAAAASAGPPARAEHMTQAAEVGTYRGRFQKGSSGLQPTCIPGSDHPACGCGSRACCLA